MSNISFQELGISPEILRAIGDMGFEHATEIQAKAIPILGTLGKDFVGQAQTGTGKTAAFGIPLLEKMNFKSDHVQALVLCPTRELASQVESEIKKLGKYLPVKTTSIYGGASYEKQTYALRREKPQIVVGTPGRVIDMIKKGILKLDQASYCVLDEADEMLNMGFYEDVQTILDIFNKERQMIMFSATMPQQIIRLIGKSFQDYEMVRTERKNLSNANIEQKYFLVKERYFKESLARILDVTPDFYGIVFCKTRVETKEVGDDLKKRGYSVEILNGDMGQNERERTMRIFKEGRAKIMVCTDVAARGIDVNNLTHVINYGVPQDNESYVHRIGRTGRAGMQGIALSIVSRRMISTMRRIEQLINKKIELAKLPSVEELKKRVVETEIESVQTLCEAVQKRGSEFEVDSTFESFKKEFEGFGQEELLKLMFTWKFNKALRGYNNLPDIEEGLRDAARGPGRTGHSAGGRRNGNRGAERRSSGRRPDRSDRSGRSDRPGRPGARNSEGRSSDRRSFNDRPSERRSTEGRSDRRPTEGRPQERRSARRSPNRRSDRGEASVAARH